MPRRGTIWDWSPIVPAGLVTFDVVNAGEDTHEMIVFHTDLDPKALPPSGVNRGEVDEALIGEYMGGWEDVRPGSTVNGTLVLTPGRYVLLCNLPKHYENGMVATLQAN